MNTSLLQYMPRDWSSALAGRHSGNLKPFGAAYGVTLKVPMPGEAPVPCALFLLVPVDKVAGFGIPLPVGNKIARVYAKSLVKAAIRDIRRRMETEANAVLDKVLATPNPAP